MLRDVYIHPVANGYIVTVGCQTFVFEDAATMLREIGLYLNDPEGTEKRYRETAKNIKYTLGSVVAGSPPDVPTETRGGAFALNGVSSLGSYPR